jgi:adenine-specific DNA-methyltransferase
MSHTADRLATIRNAATGLLGADLSEAGRALLGSMGYRSPKTLEAPNSPEDFLSALSMDPTRFDSLDRWRAVHFLFQLTGDELPSLARGGNPATGEGFQRAAIDSFVFLAIDLDDGDWSRRQLVAIVRTLNRGFSMPAILLFRHGGKATLAVIDRRANRRDTSRDVVGGRISLVKDIDLSGPHRAHVEILADLSLVALAGRGDLADFRDLYDRWLDTLSAAELNKRFYDELADWFAWASTCAQLSFPRGQGSGEGAKEIALIRLLTRLMFVWFIKEKGLVPEALFDPASLSKLLKQSPAASPADHGYYLAILQNLFFATLNTEMGENRRWRIDEGGKSGDYLGHHVYRHASLFADPDKALSIFSDVPFLNGGLFECLDTEVAEDDPRADQAERERGRLVLRIDGFSDQPDKQPGLPNSLFFGGEDAVDLTSYFGKRRVVNVSGLVDLFGRYKFTVEENTPLEEEAALDPELLGKVFENLLASYNEDTKTTARNKSGSFYTPREVVDFMVDEALVAWLLPRLPGELPLGATRPHAPSLDFGAMPGELELDQPPAVASTEASGDETRLRALLNFASRTHDFSAAQVDALVAAIESCKAIDPAVGSGAFPLGLLQKLVHVLDVLDPGGEKWKARNRLFYERQLTAADAIPAAGERETEVERAKAALADFDAKFESGHYPDYTRKLFLIERCLHGVDIQPVAVQIAKLRCFISLAVEQREHPERPNRGITPLPNLETKFVAANTLTPLHRQGVLASEAQISKQRDLREAYRSIFSASNAAGKRRARSRIDALRKGIVEDLSRDGSLGRGEATDLAAWDPFDPNASAPFFDSELMFGLEPSASEGWFDIAFANPPYIRQEKIETFRINDRPVIAKAQLKADYETYAGTADIYVYFYERALRLLKPQGALAFITSNQWHRLGYGKGLRSWLCSQARILRIVDFGAAPVFEAIAYPSILIGTRRSSPRRPDRNEMVLVLKWTSEGENPKASVKRFPERFADSAFEMPQRDLTESVDWQFIPRISGEILSRLRSRPQTVKDYVRGTVHRGITTGYNDAFEIDHFQRQSLLEEDASSAELIRPLLKGKDLSRWNTPEPSRWIIFVRRGTRLSDYPAIGRHLSRFRERLQPKPKDWSGPWPGRKAGSYEWFEIQDNVAYWPVFEKRKVVSNKVTDKPNFSIDSSRSYLANTAYCFDANDPEFVTAVLNSTVLHYVSRQVFANKEGGFYEVQPEALLNLPVPRSEAAETASLTLVVKALLAGAERSRLEALINAFVYELFFAEELLERNLRPFQVAREAGLLRLSDLEGPALARAADDWSRSIADPAHPLYATLFDLQSIDAVRIIEGRA